jgi:branched-subunit amino acid transport protein
VSVWSGLAIVGIVGAMTYTMRAVAIVALADRTIPASFERALRHVGPAVLMALAVSLAAGGDGGPSLDVAEVAALVAGGVVALLRRNVLWTLAAGMTALWLVAAII